MKRENTCFNWINLLLIVAIFYPFFCGADASAEGLPKSAHSEVLVESCTSWNKDSIPAYPAGTPKITILKITVPANTKLDWHKHPMMNVGIIMQGEITVQDDQGNEQTFKKGDAIIECVNRWHFGCNKGNKDAVLYVVYAGIEEQPLSVKK